MVYQVVKLRFRKDKDLVFVAKLKGAFFTKPVEKVCETTHLQVLPPSVRTGDNMCQEPLMTLSCMNSIESFILYKDSKHCIHRKPKAALLRHMEVLEDLVKP